MVLLQLYKEMYDVQQMGYTDLLITETNSYHDYWLTTKGCFVSDCYMCKCFKEYCLSLQPHSCDLYSQNSKFVHL